VEEAMKIGQCGFKPWYIKTDLWTRFIFISFEEMVACPREE
jgi:hypothetical protein